MCADMGTEPIEEEIPKDLNDFSNQTHEAYLIFNKLPDNIHGFSGQYIGKDLSNLKILFELYNVEENNWLLYMDLINCFISEYAVAIDEKSKREAKLKEAKLKNGKHNSKRT